MNMTLDTQTSYPQDLSFVLKLHRDTNPATGLFGRLEHVVTGRKYPFGTAEELLSCLATAAAAASAERSR